ncbi:MAG: MFS transporter [Terriglobia bacterium]|jgi:GPH family glycoside/pentoside/hexuronide:cation symporter
MPTSNEPQPVRLRERVGYATGDLASCLYYNTFVLFLLNFYTDKVGLAPAAVGTMILVTRTGDTFADPMMGMLADRTKSRFGKFRPWLLWMAFPFFITGVLAFLSPNLGPTGKLAYAYATYMLVMLVYTAINIPYGALLGVITPDSDERTKLSSFRFVGAFTGNLIVQGTFLFLVKALGHGNDKAGFPLTMGLYGFAAMCFFLFTFAATRERVVGPAGDQSSVGGDLGDLLRNRPWLALGGASIVFLTWVSIRGASLVYYFKYFVVQGVDIAFNIGPAHHFAHHFDSVTLLSTYFLSGTVCSLVGVTITAPLTKFFGGKKKTYMWLSIINVLTLVPVYFAGAKDLALIFACNMVGSLFTGSLNPLVWAMYADTADYAEWKFGSRATGLVFSAGTFAQKMGWTVGGAIAGWLLAFYGFHANVAQNVGTLYGIRLMVSLIPAAASLFTVLVIAVYNLDAKLMDQIGAELKVRREAAVHSAGTV